MIHNRKNVFTVQLDGSKGETPELLLAAITMAIFDLMPALQDDDGVLDAKFDQRDVLTKDEAKEFIKDGREIVMFFPKGRMGMAHAFASRLTPTECEIVLKMYDEDGDVLMARVGEQLDQLVLLQDIDVEVELDLNDDLAFDDEVTEPCLVLPRTA